MKKTALFSPFFFLAVAGCTSDEPATPPPPVETSRPAETAPAPPPVSATQPEESSPSYSSSEMQPEGTPPVGSTTASPEDQELEERIRLALQVDTSLSVSIEKIQIEANNGEVTLQGEVPSEQEKEGIGTTIEQMEGVKKIENQLQVARR